MNGIERIMATLNGQEKDQTAVILTLSLYGAGLIKAPLTEYYNRPELFAEGQAAIRETFHPDLISTPFFIPGEGEAFGSTIKYFNADAPNMQKPATESAEALLKLPIPDINTSSRLQYFIKATELVSKQCGRDTLIGAIMVSPVDLPAVIMGIDGWLETILFKTDLAKAFCEKTVEYFVTRANAFLAAGANLIILPVCFCNPEIITPFILKNVAIPIYREAFKQVKGPIVLHHTGTPMNAFNRYLKDLPNVIGFCVDHKDNLDIARENIGEDQLLLGNIDGPTLNKYSTENISRRCQRILTNRANDKHFILTSSAADIPLNTPPENIHTILQSVSVFKKDN
jgi:uroporphyrinogen decarboxylase